MAKGIATKPRTANGGTYAPPGAVKSPTTGLGGKPIAYAPRAAKPNPNAQPSAGLKSAAAGIAGTDFSGVHAAPTPYTGTPWDAAKEQANANANAKYNAALLNLGYKKTAEQEEYGLDPGFNDYKANPYSRAALLQQTYQRANRASGNSLAAAGQLYAGSSQNAETYNREHNSQELNALESVYRRALQNIGDEEAGALSTREEEKGNALWKSIEAASNAELEPDTAPGAGGGGKSDGPAYRSNNSNKNGKPVGAKRFAAAYRKGRK